MLSESAEWKYLAWIHSALLAAAATVKQFAPGVERAVQRVAAMQGDASSFHRGLFTVADQCIVQTVPERAEPGLVVTPLEEPVAENRLAHLL
jgi:hypothetical protein